MISADPRRFTKSPAWNQARVEVAAAEAHRDLCRRHVEDLEAADRLHHQEAARHREQVRRAGRDLPILTPAEASRLYGAGHALIEYHPPIDPARIAAAKDALTAAEADVAQARATLETTATEEWDPVGEARQAGARYIVAVPKLPLGNVTLYGSAPIPPELLDGLPWQKVDALKRSHTIVEV